MKFQVCQEKHQCFPLGVPVARPLLGWKPQVLFVEGAAPSSLFDDEPIAAGKIHKQKQVGGVRGC